MNFRIPVGRGQCGNCGTDLVVIEHALAYAIPDEARAEAMRAVMTIGRDEQLVIANEDGTFACPVCEQSGRLHALTLN
jgi:hypothetical protein